MGTVNYTNHDSLKQEFLLALACSAVLGTGAAIAQDAQVNPAGLEQVMVTATKRAESIQETVCQ
jgi:hypothetical protein